MKMVLVGGPASGKTTVGKHIAQKWNLAFFDTDHWIEAQCGKTVSQIFADEGEASFRAWETRALEILLQQEQIIIATGGGIVKKSENRELLVHGATVIYLDVPVAVQLKRTEGDTTRPLLLGADKAAILMQLRQEREPLYRSVADIVVNGDLPIDEILDEINFSRG